MKEIDFKNEDTKYSLLWSTDYKDARWKRLAKRLVSFVGDSDKSILDCGFGTGNSMRYFKNSGFEVSGIDISSYAIEQNSKQFNDVKQASLDNIPFGDKSFDYSFCNDVIEHVAPEYIEKSIQELARVTKGSIFLSVCPTHSHHKSLNNENLHLTVQPENWWRKQFQAVGNVNKYRMYFSRSIRYRIDLPNN